jgi:poly(3-hydroxybutyrate) depolymerase
MKNSRVTKLEFTHLVWAVLPLVFAGCSDWERWLTHGEEGVPSEGGGGAPSGSAGSGAGPAGGDPTIPVPPSAREQCPTLESGEVAILGAKVRLWVGAPQSGSGGPLVVYWYGTGSSPSEATTMLGATLQDVLDQGGVVAAPVLTTGIGENTSGTGTWSSGDLDVVDELVACAVEQLGIDPRRIYTAGCSSGGLQAGVFANARSNYVAAAMLNSGGQVLPTPLQDPARAPAVITAHGAGGTDVVIIDFAEASLRYAQDLASQGGFAVDCDHGGGHCAAPPELRAAQWAFAKAHPYGVEPEPYASALPAEFPDYCEVVAP